MKTQRHEARSETRSAVLLALGAVLAALVALAGMARVADAAYPGGNGRKVFQSAARSSPSPATALATTTSTR